MDDKIKRLVRKFQAIEKNHYYPDKTICFAGSSATLILKWIDACREEFEAPHNPQDD